MVIRGSTRGNGKQLAGYLLSKKDNENIHVLEVEGKVDADKKELFYALASMSLTSDLTKSDKGLYHAIINPGYGDDQKMTPDDWMKAADILAKHTKFENQRRIIVLHEKKGRTHAHVVFERYDHEKGKMKSDSWNYRGQDKARFEMEKVFAHAKTPNKNLKRPEARRDLTELWKSSKSGRDFIAAAKANGYIIAKGSGRRPYMVIDNTGRSFDLVREIQGVKTKEVKERLSAERLKTDKEEIELIRIKQAKEPTNEKISFAARKALLASEFSVSREDIIKEKGPAIDLKKILADKLSGSNSNADDILKSKKEDEEERFKKVAKGFADNRDDQLTKESEAEQFRKELMEKLDRMRQEQKDKENDKGYGIG
jgi:hypothetical protein